MEERRAVLAPNDNLAEVLSPLVILLVLLCEALVDMSGLETVSQHFRETGILKSWRRMNNNGQAIPVDQTVVMMIVLILIRSGFCWFESRVRERLRRAELRRNAHARRTTFKETVHELRRRACSAEQFFGRIANTNASKPIQYMAVVFVALQPVMLVTAAAVHGRRL